MARWRQDPQLLAALMTIGLAATGCDVVDRTDASGAAAGASTRPAQSAFFGLLDSFLKGGDPMALIESHGAIVDRSFASSGGYAFTAPGLADPGSELGLPVQRPTSSPTLSLVPPPAVPLKLADVSKHYGTGKRLPALPNQGWIYAFKVAGGRIVARLTSDPDLPTSKVQSVTALREG